MPILQVRDLPEEVYIQIQYLAEKEHRSLTQQTIHLLEESVAKKIANKNKRLQLFKKIEELQINGNSLPDPVCLIREDRER